MCVITVSSMVFLPPLCTEQALLTSLPTFLVGSCFCDGCAGDGGAVLRARLVAHSPSLNDNLKRGEEVWRGSDKEGVCAGVWIPLRDSGVGVVIEHRHPMRSSYVVAAA